MAGYSGTPLSKKLGVSAGHRVLLDGAPPAFALGDLPGDVVLHHRLSPGLYDVILCFCPDLARLRRRWPVLHRLTPPAGALWVAWPKRSSRTTKDVGMRTLRSAPGIRASGLTKDLDEQVVREYALANGRVDVKVCAVDDTWSGLKHVIRVSDR